MTFFLAGDAPAALTTAAPGRAFAALALGAVVGLGLAGYGLFSVPAGAGVALPAGAVARVNDGLILSSDFRTQTEALHDVPFERSTPAQRQEVLDNMIAEELLVQRGLEIGMPATGAEVREALVNAVNRQSATDVDARPPGEQQLRQYHAAHPERYASVGTMHIADLSVPLAGSLSAEAALGVARQAARALRAGSSVARTAAAYGLRSNAQVGQESQIDAAVLRFLGAPLFAEARKLAAGAVSDPVRTEDGVHILVCISRSPSAAQDFALSRQQVLADYQRDEGARRQQEYVRFLRDKASIVVGSP